MCLLLHGYSVLLRLLTHHHLLLLLLLAPVPCCRCVIFQQPSVEQHIASFVRSFWYVFCLAGKPSNFAVLQRIVCYATAARVCYVSKHRLPHLPLYSYSAQAAAA
jgi:hypothetical protein